MVEESLMKRLIAILLVLAAASACTGKQAAKPENQAQIDAARQAETQMMKMSSEEIALKVAEAGKPGQAHAYLQPLVGKWETSTKMWISPDQAPSVSKGSATHEWVLGKRFLKEEFKGSFDGHPFQGMGTTGFDNVRKEYIGTWIDSLATGIMTSDGTYDPQTRSLQMNGVYSCPITGTQRSSRMVTRIVNNNMHILEMYDRDAQGKEYKSMEITYKRKA